jgi:hypothetical protein
MKEHKTLAGAFNWVPMDKRMSKFGGPMSPRKPELRRPVLWLARSGNELYLVNDSREVLEAVDAGYGGWITADDQVGTVASEAEYRYENVQPGAAVKVEEYDGFYDLDFMLSVRLTVRSPRLGCLEIETAADKGGIDETILIWDTGEPGKWVKVKPCGQDKWWDGDTAPAELAAALSGSPKTP